MFLIMMKTNIRVGNKKYCLENGSYGLTTMLKRHLNKDYVFKFKGKSNIKHSIPIQDDKLKKFLNFLKRIPGKELFKYKEENGIKNVTSNDMNNIFKQKLVKNLLAKILEPFLQICILLNTSKNYPSL